MTIQEFREYMASGKPVIGGGDVHMMFHRLSQEALRSLKRLRCRIIRPQSFMITENDQKLKKFKDLDVFLLRFIFFRTFASDYENTEMGLHRLR